ncbi:CCA tRNA nucleotidyltransferase [Bacillus massilinigeriensis]|uniref:CCA tRNA nucleotidyltransferase n=1 Tax=Bacillus mediterraneensis TaxID=1805474 RepID=UPI0008F832C2|nr:CCA tRNA nucleotidyltransferase [Bacillus mediterraneensis]
MNPLFLEAVPLLEKLELEGYEAYFVGGSVRDSMLGRVISDIDIATSATPLELKEIFSKTVDIGIMHGTILVIYNGKPYEVTTFRMEGTYSDGRRPDRVEFIRSLQEDLMRRDFTMNAMAMDKTGNIIDPFHGQLSIRQKMITSVGNPDERFGEDALRMLRAIRFSSQLGFEIEEKTYAALKSSGPLLSSVAVERKAAEFEKLLGGPFRSKAIMLLTGAGIHNFLPGLQGKETALYKLSECESEIPVEGVWVLLLHALNSTGKEAEMFLKQWRLPSKKIKSILRVLVLLKFRLKSEWDKISIYHAGFEFSILTEVVFDSLTGDGDSGKVQAIYSNLPIKKRAELDITGEDLLLWREQTPGAWVKELLAEIEARIVKGNLENEKSAIKEWLISCKLI